MNIFKTNEDPRIAAQEHCDKHVVKMCVEYAQLLSTAHRMIDGEMYYSLSKNNRRIRRYKHPNKRLDENLMKACHFNHPSNVWARETKGNYIWLYTLLDYSLQEYTERYNKIHGVQWRMPFLIRPPKKINQSMKVTELPQAMPEYCKIPGNPIAAYKNYYIKEKTRFAVWKNGNIPLWFQEKDIGI